MGVFVYYVFLCVCVSRIMSVSVLFDFFDKLVTTIVCYKDIYIYRVVYLIFVCFQYIIVKGSFCGFPSPTLVGSMSAVRIPDGV